MSVAVVVDGAAALPEDLAAAHGITVVPMTLVVDGEARPESAVGPDDLMGAAAAGRVTTAAPGPGDYAPAIEAAAAGADAVLVLTLSAEMSSSLDAARLAARSAPGPVEVLDTRSAAGGEGLVALAAARAGAGGTLTETVAAVRDVIGRVRLVATVDDLDALARSGRVPNLARRAVTALHIKPLFEFRDGAAHALTPAHGERAARHRIVERCLADRPDGPSRLHVAALDGWTGDRARGLLDDVLAAAPDADAFVGSFGAVMAVHLGPGVSGLAWWWEPTPSPAA